MSPPGSREKKTGHEGPFLCVLAETVSYSGPFLLCSKRHLSR